MKEEEWKKSTSAKEMLSFLREERPRFFKSQVRELQQFLVACCWKNEDLLVDKNSRDAVRNAERYLDGEIDEKELYRLDWYAEAAVFGILYAESLERIDELKSLIEGVERVRGLPFETARETLLEAAYLADYTLIYPGIHNQHWVMKVFNEKFTSADLLREHVRPFSAE